MAADQHFEEVDMNEILRERFAAGKGVLTLSADTPDALLLHMMRKALKMSEGKAFVVMSSPAVRPIGASDG